jgi:hypothetical protein
MSQEKIDDLVRVEPNWFFLKLARENNQLTNIFYCSSCGTGFATCTFSQAATTWRLAVSGCVAPDKRQKIIDIRTSFCQSDRQSSRQSVSEKEF